MSPKKGPAFVFSGTIAPVSGKWHAVYFEVSRSGADEETVATLPVACWAACVRGKEHIVGGMVAGVSGLELAELDRDFRGYAVMDEEPARSVAETRAVREFIDVWERENGFEDSEEEDEPDDDGEEEEDDDEQE